MMKNKVFVVCGILKYFVFLLIFACIKHISLIFTYLNVVKVGLQLCAIPVQNISINKKIYSKRGHVYIRGNRMSRMKVIPIFGLLRLPNHVELTVTRVPPKIRSLIPDLVGIEILRGRSESNFFVSKLPINIFFLCCKIPSSSFSKLSWQIRF